MASSSFTFVNTTDGAALSHAASKQMRAHVTKTNFAKRRQRLGKAPPQAGRTNARGSMTMHQGPNAPVQSALVAGFHKRWHPSLLEARDSDDPQAKFMVKFWGSLFSPFGSLPASTHEHDWQNLICSEPSLLHTTVAIGIRHWASEKEYQRVADQYWSSATNTLIEHISSGTAYTDAVIGTVMTMAFGERLVQNNAAWKVHIDGLTEMLNQRYERGERTLPPWLYEMVISDATNYVLGFPRWYHPQLAQVICKYGLPAISDIEKMCSALVEVLKSIDEVQAALPSQTSGLKELEIDKRVRDILRQARALRANDTPCVCITATTVELILSLSWPQHELAVEGAATAEEMRQALGRFCVRPCCYADLTSGYLMIGAIAADEGSETRQWFISRLKDSLASVRADGSPIDTTEALKTEFVDKIGSMLYSNVLWNDVFA